MNEENFNQLIPATPRVEEIELVGSTNETDSDAPCTSPREDNFSAAPESSKSSQVVLTETAQATRYEDEPEADDYSSAEFMEKSIQPSHQKVQSILQQLREIPCTP